MIIASTYSEAFISMLQDTLKGSQFLQTTMVQPIESHLTDNVRLAFEGYKFSDNRFGRLWIQDRIAALFDRQGEYWKPLHREGQFDYVLSALKGMIHGTMPRWNANRLILNLFQPKDLHKSRCPIPPCLISLCFYPIKHKLTLIATFRAQYTDAKGYGNLLSLAMLLLQVCEETNFKPYRLYSIAQKTILKYPRTECRKLLHTLLAAESTEKVF